jgi:ketosteroid isomerase-like protein
MTATPAEVFARLLEGITERRWDELAELYAEDVVVEMPFAAPGPARIVGREEVRSHFAAAAAGPLAFAADHVVVHVTADPEVVIAEFEYVGRVATTGTEFRVANIQVLRVRDGHIVESRDYHDHQGIAHALADVQSAPSISR